MVSKQGDTKIACIRLADSEGECDRGKGKGGGRQVQTVRPELESGCLRGGPIGSSGGERAYR